MSEKVCHRKRYDKGKSFGTYHFVIFEIGSCPGKEYIKNEKYMIKSYAKLSGKLSWVKT